MKQILASGLLTATICVGAGQTPLSVNSSDLPGLTLPYVVSQNHGFATVDLTFFNKTDHTLRSGASVGYGVAPSWQVTLAGTFADVDHYSLGSGSFIRYGGSDGELSVKYRLPISWDATVQAGLTETNTPAQSARTAATFGATVGYPIDKSLKVYLNPRLVTLDHNSLLGIGLGATYEVNPKVSIFGDWTPVIAGENTVNTTTGREDRAQLYGFGVRLNKIVSNFDLDLGYTNIVGETTGFSLTPSLGSEGGLYASLGIRF